MLSGPPQMENSYIFEYKSEMVILLPTKREFIN